MELQEYREIVKGRLMSLPEEKQALIAGIDDTEAGAVLMEVLGEELFGAAPQEQAAPQAPMPQEQQAVRGGLGAR